MERLGAPAAGDIKIRFHHLELWSDLSTEYLKKFNGVRPWDLSSEQSGPLKYFIREFSKNIIKRMIKQQRILEDIYLQGFDEKSSLAYSYDFMGSNPKSYFKAYITKKELFQSTFNQLMSDRGTPILLITEPDDYCGTCTVGKHCNRTFLGRILKRDRDYFYRSAIIHLIAKHSFEDYVAGGLITKEDNGNVRSPEFI